LIQRYLRAFLVGLALLAAPMVLTGCGAASKIEAAAGLQNPAGITQVYTLRATYTATFLNFASAYRQLGVCPAGTGFSVQRPCAERPILVKLQAVDVQAQAAMNKAEEFAKKYPGKLGTSGLYDAAVLAVNAAGAVITTYNLTTY
jgi:hypothetical protein